MQTLYLIATFHAMKANRRNTFNRSDGGVVLVVIPYVGGLSEATEWISEKTE